MYDRIVESRRTSGRSALMDADGRLRGPFNAMVISPAVGDALQHLGAAIRYRSTLPDRAREIAILTVAAHRRSAFEWFAHEAPARDAGLTDADRASVRDGSGAGLADSDDLVRRSVVALLDDRDLDDEAFDAVQSLLGVAGAVELVTVVGYYDLLALGMQAFRVPLPAEAEPAP